MFQQTTTDNNETLSRALHDFHTIFPLTRFKPRFSAVLQIFFVGGRLRLSCGRARLRVYVLIAVKMFLRGLRSILAVSCGSLQL